MDRPRAMEEELPSSSAIFISADSFPARSGRTGGASSNGSGLFPANHNSNPSGGAAAAAGRLGNSGARTLRLAVEAQTTFIAETADLLAVESRVQQQQRGRVPSRSSDDSFGSTIPSSSFSSPVQSPFSHSSFPTSPPSSSLSSPPLSSPAIQTPGSPSSPDASPQPLDPQLLRFSLVKAAGTEKERQLLEVLLRVYIPNTPDFEIWRQLPPEKLQEMVRWSLRTSDLRPHPMPETIIQRKFLAQTTAKPATTNAASKRKRVARRTVSQLEPSPPGWNDQGLWQVDLCFAFTFPTKTLAPVYISFEIEGLGLALSHPIVAFIHVREYPVALESILWHKLGRSRGSVPVEHALFAIDRFFLCWKSVRPIRDDIDLRYLLQQARATSPHLTESEFGIIWKRAYAMHELLLEDENFKTLWRNRPKLVEGYAMRDDTERLLLGHPTGTFLIRLGSQEAKVSISYRSTEFGVQHALIEHTKTKEDESYRDANSDECYPSLFKLILRSPTLEQILVTQANGGTQVIPKSAMEPLLRNSERKRRARTDYQSLDGAPNGTCLSCEEKDRRIEELQSELENLKVLLELERSVFQPPVSDVVAELGMSYLNIAQKNDAPPACWPIPQPLSLGPHQGAPAPSTSAGMRHAAEVDAYLISGI